MMKRPMRRTSVFPVMPSVRGTLRTQAMTRARSASLRCRNISEGMKHTPVPSGFTPLPQQRDQLRVAVVRHDGGEIGRDEPDHVRNVQRHGAAEILRRGSACNP